MPLKTSYIMEWGLISPITQTLCTFWKKIFMLSYKPSSYLGKFSAPGIKKFLILSRKTILTFRDNCWSSRKIKKSLVLWDETKKTKKTKFSKVKIIFIISQSCTKTNCKKSSFFCFSRNIQYFISVLETISANVFNILYLAWKLFQLKQGKSPA